MSIMSADDSVFSSMVLSHTSLSTIYSYASSGTGIGVAVKSEFDWQTGYFVVESDDEGATEEVIIEEKDSYE